MSIAHYDIRCDRCGLNMVNPDACAFLEYLLPDGGRIHIMWHAAWCYDCNGFTLTENFPSRETAKSRLRELAAGRDRFAGMRRELLPREYHDFGWRIDELEQFMPFYNFRRTSPKCLSCGGANFAPVQIPRPEEGKIAVMEFAHPGCGGHLLVSESPFRFALRRRTHLYDIEGTFLREEMG